MMLVLSDLDIDEPEILPSWDGNAGLTEGASSRLIPASHSSTLSRLQASMWSLRLIPSHPIPSHLTR